MPAFTQRPDGSAARAKRIFSQVPGLGVRTVRRAYTKRNGVWSLYHTDDLTATISASIPHVVIPQLFLANDWASTADKYVRVTGAQVWSYAEGLAAMRTGTGRGGNLFIDIDGNAGLYGKGGNPNGGEGGTALLLEQAGVHLTVRGQLFGGGAGGGHGGQGGPGFFDTAGLAVEGPRYSRNVNCWRKNTQSNTWDVIWDGGRVAQTNGDAVVVGGYTYRRGAFVEQVQQGGGILPPRFDYHQIQREYATSFRTDTQGGPGGNGGRGYGFNANLQFEGTIGEPGQGGGQNAGPGGSGATAGDWGQNANAGNPGGNGNAGGGQGGTAGGLGGFWIRGVGFLASFNNLGDIRGRQA